MNYTLLNCHHSGYHRNIHESFAPLPSHWVQLSRSRSQTYGHRVTKSTFRFTLLPQCTHRTPTAYTVTVTVTVTRHSAGFAVGNALPVMMESLYNFMADCIHQVADKQRVDTVFMPRYIRGPMTSVPLSKSQILPSFRQDGRHGHGHSHGHGHGHGIFILATYPLVTDYLF
jgi:hypothetical protein